MGLKITSPRPFSRLDSANKDLINRVGIAFYKFTHKKYTKKLLKIYLKKLSKCKIESLFEIYTV